MTDYVLDVYRKDSLEYQNKSRQDEKRGWEGVGTVPLPTPSQTYNKVSHPDRSHAFAVRIQSLCLPTGVNLHLSQESWETYFKHQQTSPSSTIVIK